MGNIWSYFWSFDLPLYIFYFFFCFFYLIFFFFFFFFFSHVMDGFTLGGNKKARRASVPLTRGGGGGGGVGRGGRAWWDMGESVDTSALGVNACTGRRGPPLPLLFSVPLSFPLSFPPLHFCSHFLAALMNSEYMRGVHTVIHYWGRTCSEAVQPLVPRLTCTVRVILSDVGLVCACM